MIPTNYESCHDNFVLPYRAVLPKKEIEQSFCTPVDGLVRIGEYQFSAKSELSCSQEKFKN